jgi:putative chitinase
MQLSEHFSLEELTITNHREFDNTPNDAELENLKRMAEFLEEVRALLGKPLLINSCYRSEQINNSVGSKSTSQHRVGCATDFRVNGMTPDEVVKAIITSDLNFDQIIREFDRWTHISIPNSIHNQPRKQALIIDKSGTRLYNSAV